MGIAQGFDWLPYVFLAVVLGYFGLLLLVGRIANRGDGSNAAFFTGGRRSPWYVVAFGMIGASLSGVTFISVPGAVGADGFAYFQMVLGYLPGYAFIALVLLPLYYRLKLTTIYGYLEQRLGRYSYRTGSAFFLLSRTIGSSFRLYIVAMVLHRFVFEALGLPFWLTVALTLALIWLYTFQGGIGTIVWTDTLQTLFMLLALVLSIVLICTELGVSVWSAPALVSDADMGRVFFWDAGWSDSKNFFKQFLGGAFIAIAMTGLDQDMMQKNLTCRNLPEARKNMLWFSLALVPVNLLFLLLGGLLYLYAAGLGLDAKGDMLFPTLAFEHFPLALSLIFLIGLIAAAYSSADSALTALTTAFCVDFLGMRPEENAAGTGKRVVSVELLDDLPDEEQEKNRRERVLRRWVHLGFSALTFLVLLLFYWINDNSVLKAVFTVAGYTYGPLLGLFAFALFAPWKVRDAGVPVVCLLAPVLTYVVNAYSEQWLWGYKFGFELLLVNAMLTVLGLLALAKRA